MRLLDYSGLTSKITRPRLRSFLARYASDGSALDVGAAYSYYRQYFPNSTTLDVAPRPGVTVDIVGDAHDMAQVGDCTFDVVLCTEVLEHLHTPARAIAEFRRVLRPGGLLLLSTRFVFPLHDTPGDLYRFTRYGLEHLLAEFDIVEIAEEATTVETLGVLLQRIGYQCETLGWRGFKLGWFMLAQMAIRAPRLLTREYGDIERRRPESAIMTSGYYVAARRPACASP